MILYSFYAILGLILCLIIFLYTYYSVLEKRQIKLENELETRSKDVIIPPDSVTRIAEKPVLNLIPVPQKVQFTGGNCVFPSSLVFTIDNSLQKLVADYLKMIPGIKTSYSQIGGNILFRYNHELPPQGYTLDIRQKK